jgi:hypothetical protein
MNEKLLQYIWKCGYFNQHDLCTTDGEVISIISPGEWNTDQGPDFIAGRIIISGNEWVGQIEVHIRSGDWVTHRHQADPNYRNVILHVVWEHNGHEIPGVPVLELKGRVSRLLLDRYAGWMNNMSHIPCESEWLNHGWIADEKWLDQLLHERLFKRSEKIKEYVVKSQGHWGEVFWWMLARNFGYKVNADAFEALGFSLPLSLITRHKHQIHQLEAMLMGQTGLLSGKFSDQYAKLLQREYLFLKIKYKLKPVPIPVQFLRMRPQNFPTLRLAQLARLINESVHLFNVVKECDDLDLLKKKFRVTANDYWNDHYRFDETSARKEKMLGNSMIENLFINTVIPVLFAYGIYHNDKHVIKKAIDWMYSLQPENNVITAIYERVGLTVKSAAESQALYELKKDYCDQKRCLECFIGKSFLFPGMKPLAQKENLKTN